MAGRKKKRTHIAGQFGWRLVEMQESPAYRVLSLSEHRCLSRLEIELGHHGGNENGRLPCTYDQFEEYGVHRHSIGPALRALAALGFIEITEQGRAGNAEWRRPTLFCLTYRHTAKANPTDEWRRLQTVEEAATIARAAREAPPKKQNASGENRTKVQCGNRTTKGRIHSAEIATTCVSAESATTSIYRVGGGGGGVRLSATDGAADGSNGSGSTGEHRTFAVVSGGAVVRVGVRSQRIGARARGRA